MKFYYKTLKANVKQLDQIIFVFMYMHLNGFFLSPINQGPNLTLQGKPFMTYAGNVLFSSFPKYINAAIADGRIMLQEWYLVVRNAEMLRFYLEPKSLVCTSILGKGKCLY